MSPESLGPLSRPFPLHRLEPGGNDVSVEATAEECRALAADLALPAIRRLVARYRLTGSGERVRVAGRITAEIEQTCVVSLDSFPLTIDEDVVVEFAASDPRRPPPDAAEIELSADHDLPEELVGDRIDLGTVTAEFLALALDPYPRKPGVAFDAPDGAPASDSPFAQLASLRPKPEDS